MMIRSLLSALGNRGRKPFSSVPAPDRPFFAIGDIHGEYGALDRLFDHLEPLTGESPVICVGDYVDRGDRTAAVLDRLHRVETAFPDRFICLMGNHEAMLLAFLDEPETGGPRWLRHGGLQTLASYRVPFIRDDMVATRDALVGAMGAPMVDWLRARPAIWRSGNVAVTHAGADPTRPLDAQPESAFVWGHPDFARLPRADGIWVVHGHVVVDSPFAYQGRVAIDTGAYATGMLTAARIGPEGIEFHGSDGHVRR